MRSSSKLYCDRSLFSLLQEILTKPPFQSEINDQIKVIIDSRSLFSMSISFTVCLSLFFQILLGLLVIPEFASSSHKGNIIPFLFYHYIWSFSDTYLDLMFDLLKLYNQGQLLLIYTVRLS